MIDLCSNTYIERTKQNEMTYTYFADVAKATNIFHAGWVAKYYGIPLAVVKRWILDLTQQG